jgi:hypothetical protein
MAKPIELGLVLEGEDADRFFEYDAHPDLSDELVKMFREGLRTYEKNGHKFEFTKFRL